MERRIWAMRRNGFQFSIVTVFITPLSIRPRSHPTSIQVKQTRKATWRHNRKSIRSSSSSFTIIINGGKIWVGSTQRVDSRIDTDITNRRPRCSHCRQAQCLKQIPLLPIETMGTPITAALISETHHLYSNRKFQSNRRLHLFNLWWVVTRHDCTITRHLVARQLTRTQPQCQSWSPAVSCCLMIPTLSWGEATKWNCPPWTSHTMDLSLSWWVVQLQWTRLSR